MKHSNSLKLSSIDITGFRSFGEKCSLEAKNLNVVIGQNGAGKSNLIASFQMLKAMLQSSAGNLQNFIAQNGFAPSFLHYGPSRTQSLHCKFKFQTEKGKNDYEFGLKYVFSDELIFEYERYRFYTESTADSERLRSLGSNHKEAKITEVDNNIAKTLISFVKQINFYQFHNTTATSAMKQRSVVTESFYLKSDGSNIASVIFRLSTESPQQYKKLIASLRYAIPFFGDFFLIEENGTVMLRWTEVNSEFIFQPHRISDGMLRIICLFTLMHLPANQLPKIIFIDEPELGLHPVALFLLVELLKDVSEKVQVFVCTQSPQVVDMVDLEDIVIIDRVNGQSTIHRPSIEELAGWMESYSNSQLWEKNILGGRP